LSSPAAIAASDSKSAATSAMRGAQVNLTARKESAGAAAVRKLAAPGLAVVYHQLDVTDEKSINAVILRRQCPIRDAAHLLSAPR
jgi:NADP-dependent 3-hydroxy acid dehydrogenase YdfG